MHVSHIQYRLNYIIWIQDLIDSTAEGSNEGYDREREVVGLDMYVSCPTSFNSG